MMNTIDRSTPANGILPLGVLIIGVSFWWVMTTLFGVPAYILPSPQAVAARLLEHPSLYLSNALQTLKTMLVGGIVGAMGGFAMAVIITYSPLLRRAIYPYFVTVRVLPKIALAPILLIYLGTGMVTATIFVALVAFFPMLVITTAGLRDVPEQYLDLAMSVDSGTVETLFAIRLPAALPAVFAALKQVVVLALVGTVVAEWVVINGGLGSLILLGAENIQPAVTFAAVVVLFVEGLILYALVDLVHWQVRQRTGYS